MSSQGPFDLEGAREDGEAFGREIGHRTAIEMTQASPSDAELTGIGAGGVSSILARANALADAGVDQEILTAWTEAAADAFSLELEQAAALLNTPEGSTSKH